MPGGRFAVALAAGVLAAASAAAAQTVAVDVLDATIKDKRLDGADVIFQQNGEQSVTAKTDAQGKARLTPRKPLKGDELLIIKKTGFSDLVVKCPCDGLTYALSPIMKGLDSLRIVLNWGATPFDLDSHLAFSNNHIFFNAKNGEKAWLDVDDTSSYGPETITIDKRLDGTTYTYAVHDYSNAADVNDRALSASGARVFVYVGQSLVKTYYVPTGTGNVWTVFRITGDGSIEDIDTLGGASSDNIARYMAGGLSPRTARAASDTASARRHNALGEKAYHRGDYETAIEQYQTALDYDSSFAPAYGNLGLAYRKLNRFAESIWASRKAITFASGENAGKRRAAAYYEIAKLYENAGDFESARKNYQFAKQNSNNPAYDEAIARMNARLR